MVMKKVILMILLLSTLMISGQFAPFAKAYPPPPAGPNEINLLVENIPSDDLIRHPMYCPDPYGMDGVASTLGKLEID